MSVNPGLSKAIVVFRKCEHQAWVGGMVLMFLAVPEYLWAQECSPDGQAVEGMRIVEISIDNRNIFDLEQEEQNLLIHRWANKLHINTRQKTIEDQLLFDLEDEYKEHLVEETERLLRSRNYIHDAEITAEEVCGKGVRLTVATTDNWTLTPSISASRSGGETRTSFEIEESNLLGLGTELQILSESDEDRDSDAFVFRDPNWFGDFKILRLEIAENSDGHLYETSLVRPFVQLDSNYAWSVALSSHELENPIYEQGDVVGKVGEENESILLTYGWSEGLVDNSVSRYNLGWFANELRYHTVDDPSIELPESVDKYYPFFEYEFLQLKYVEKINFRVMGVTEDIELGNSWKYRIGWKDEAYDATQEGYIFGFEYNFGSFISTHSLALFNLKMDQESNKTIDDTGFLEVDGRLYNFRDENNSYLFKARFEAAQNPELFDRLEVGGDSGLKGYPVRFQNGDRALTLSAEKRVYFNVYLWQLVKFGFAVFAEVGSAWDSGDNPVWLSDVGAGVRLVSTRQSSAKVLHIDIAVPLSERDQIDDYQLFVKARSEF